MNARFRGPVARALARYAALAPLAALTIAGCGRGGPVRVGVLVPDPTAPSGFTVEPREIVTLDDPDFLVGEAANVRAGVVITSLLGLRSTDSRDEVRELLVRESGAPLRLHAYETEGVKWPADLHALGAATAYYHLEQAYLFFTRRLGLERSTLARLEVDYWVEVHGESTAGGNIIADDAFYFSPLGALLIAPFTLDRGVPYALNGGVMAHLITRAVGNALLHDGEPFPAVYRRWTSRYAINLLLSFEAGLGDLFAAEVTGAPDLYRASAPDDGDARRVDALHCYSHEVKDLWGRLIPIERYVRESSPDLYDPHLAGSVLASALWAATLDAEARGVRRDEVLSGFLDSFRALRRFILRTMGEGGSGFNEATVVSAVVESASPTVRRALCERLVDRLSLRASAPGACSGVEFARECP